MPYIKPPNSTSDRPQEETPGNAPSGMNLRQPEGVLPKSSIRDEHTGDKRAAPLPGWPSTASAWCGALAVFASIALPFIGKSRRSTGALRHRHWFSGDVWAPIPLCLAMAALLLGVAVLWQSRHRQKPYPAMEINHRAQAWAGILLGMVAFTLICAYVLGYVAWRAL